MIASNYRKHPEAMALQLVLAFGRCCWHTARPGARIARTIRAERTSLVKATPQLVRWIKSTVPTWYREAKKAARDLATEVRDSLMHLAWDAPKERRKGRDWEQLVIDDYEKKTGNDWRTREPKQLEKCNVIGHPWTTDASGKPTRCGLDWCEESNWDGKTCRAAFCGLKGPKGGYH